MNIRLNSEYYRVSFFSNSAVEIESLKNQSQAGRSDMETDEPENPLLNILVRSNCGQLNLVVVPRLSMCKAA